MNELTRIESGQTMSSIEIASLTGKEHSKVMADIKRILNDVLIDDAQFSGIYLDSMNRKQTIYNLPRRECDLVISGYSVKYRLVIIDRWIELELKNLKSPLQLAKEQVVLYERLEQIQNQLTVAIRTKAEIGSKREATAMNTASQATKEAAKLKIELDKSKEYSSVKRMEKIHRGAKFNWRLLKATGIALNIASIDIPDQNYTTVKAYHADVWFTAYGINITK